MRQRRRRCGRSLAPRATETRPWSTAARVMKRCSAARCCRGRAPHKAYRQSRKERMAIEVAKVELKSVQDASGLEACIRKDQFAADQVIAVIGKTEGNG